MPDKTITRKAILEMLMDIWHFIDTQAYLTKDKVVFNNNRFDLMIIFTYQPNSNLRKFVFEYKNRWYTLEELEYILLYEALHTE